MKILYLGPYRQKDDIGILSRYYLDNLCSIGVVTSRPVYINYSNADDRNIIFPSENIPNKNFDYIVQHLPVKKLVQNTYIKKNICIPILDNIQLSSQDKQKLSLFYKILADSIYSYNLFKNLKKNSVKSIKPNINQELLNKTSDTYDLGLFNLSKKTYCILDYQTNKQLLEVLIDSFAIASKYCIKDNSYLLFVYNLNQNDIQNLQNYIKSRYDLVNYKKKIINTILIPISTNESSLIAAHRTGDVFLNITESYHNSLHQNYAMILNKKIIDQTDIRSFSSYIVNNTYYPDGKLIYIVDDIVKILIGDKVKFKFESRILGPELLC